MNLVQFRLIKNWNLSFGNSFKSTVRLSLDKFGLKVVLARRLYRLLPRDKLGSCALTWYIDQLEFRITWLISGFIEGCALGFLKCGQNPAE